MKNPLRKRLLRELKEDLGKYLVIMVLMIATIGLVSGFLVADLSMTSAYNESFEKYAIENGHFRVEKQLNKAQWKALESDGVSLYENFYVEETTTTGATLRIFKNRTEVNKVCLLSGSMPEKSTDIAIDRVFANNNKIHVGDDISDGTHTWHITGFVALSDYSALFEDNNDSMFDSVNFSVAIVTEEGFDAILGDKVQYVYSWLYDDPPVTDNEKQDRAEELKKEFQEEITLKEYIPEYLNQAIHFTGDDMGGDMGMMVALLYIIIVILAFVFVITISNTISKESRVIGTLRASGYSRQELIRHYMTMPVLVTLFSALVGNILGYTWLRVFCAGLYYNSYSLPTYVTIWNGNAFLLTTVVPILLMLAVTAGMLYSKLRLSPLKFLRNDLSRGKQKRAFPLGKHIPFFFRFRLRVIFQNMGNYLVLFIGILFANFLLLFGLAFPVILSEYQANMTDVMLCKYQYILTIPEDAVQEDHKLESLFSLLQFENAVETDNEDAEEFSVASLDTTSEEYKQEEIMLYGLKDNSRYIPLDVTGNQVYASTAFRDKYNLKVGDTVTLKEAYEEDTYTFTITGFYDYEASLTLFMSQEYLNTYVLDQDKDFFCGYLSDSEITDIDEEYIGSVIDLAALTKVSRQLDKSMGSMMNMVNAFAVLIFLVLMYLLSKTIIEKNAQSISMVKILGYGNREISQLYILSTSLMVILFVLITIPATDAGMAWLIAYLFRYSMPGWIPYSVSSYVYVEMAVLGIGSYAVIALLEMRRIRRIPMDTALKNVE